ncbi:GDSL-type esterase/lipase family protein [Streptomyces sp. TLI_171]|uniref:GDSL-type esterase/lipase family protein n=1 Tax=Streptomyces sp. TLI_171 TaxID=1938859 RepID=UPI000C19CB52|nr:GDSL-type esterase/lipase family protein [Streptomyces sp. TLI_171]RKE17759.1 GDSL-like lipase/acylhydrolase family protein [Streptomyces sp. TLI_171]
MPKSRRTTPRATLALLAAAALALPAVALATPAAAAPGTGPTATVAMGDSYISGEAGRWKGNSDTTSGSRDGTDRAWTGSGYDPTRVYGATSASGCDRSDVAEVRSAPAVNQTQLNLACSGATSDNVFRAANGGQPFKGEAPQADQLAAVASQYDVKLITLSIGGNDLGFADVISTCVQDYEIWWSYCHDDQQAAVDAKMDAAMSGVGKSVDEIRAVMSAAGYGSGDYRIVLQSYPSPIPRSSENRYPESGWSRTNTGGCPFWNLDADWARDSLVPQIADRLAGVAAAKGVQFLDLRDLLQGREVCAKTARLATPTNAPSATTSEWARFLDYGSTVQGATQESFHPDYYAQQALGRCLTLLNAKTSGNWSCHNTAGQDAAGMYLAARP